MFAPDPTVVSQTTVTDDAAGNRTYTLVLQDDLFYSDGTKITAWSEIHIAFKMDALEIAVKKPLPQVVQRGPGFIT